jgi:hypothetical protein
MKVMMMMMMKLRKLGEMTRIQMHLSPLWDDPAPCVVVISCSGASQHPQGAHRANSAEKMREKRLVGQKIQRATSTRMKKEWKRQARNEGGEEEEEERREGELLRAEDDEDRGRNVGKRVGRERTPADVELRLQEAAARGADTLYLNNHSIRHLDSPLLPQVLPHLFFLILFLLTLLVHLFAHQVAECMEKLSLHLNLLTSFPLSLLSFHKVWFLLPHPCGPDWGK